MDENYHGANAGVPHKPGERRPPRCQFFTTHGRRSPHIPEVARGGPPSPATKCTFPQAKINVKKKMGLTDFIFLTPKSASARFADMKKTKKHKVIPLPIPIPSDYAVKLGVDQSYVSHVNAGRKHFGILTTFLFLKLSHKDPRVAGLTILHLRPDFEEFIPYL
jgi:hypothetical protein